MVGAHRGQSRTRIEGKTPGADGAGLPVMRGLGGVVEAMNQLVNIAKK